MIPTYREIYDRLCIAEPLVDNERAKLVIKGLQSDIVVSMQMSFTMKHAKDVLRKLLPLTMHELAGLAELVSGESVNMERYDKTTLVMFLFEHYPEWSNLPKETITKDHRVKL
jgi:hypothetical protein